MIAFLRSPRNRWIVLGCAWLLVGLLGFWGFAEAQGQEGAPPRLSDALYELQSLFGNGFEISYANLNWQLDLARWLGVLLTGLTFFQGVLSLFGERIAVARLRRARGHVVVCGLGDKGLRLARDFAADGHKVAAVEMNGGEPNVEVARDHGVLVVVGDATDGAVLGRVGAGRAGEVVTVCAEDGVNAEVAARLRAVTAGTRHDKVRCSVHVVDNQLCALLRRHTFRDTDGGLRLEFFNIFQVGAVQLAARAPVGTPDAPATVAVLGLGELGRELVRALARRAVTERLVSGGDDPAGAGPSLRLVLVDPEATAVLRSLSLADPGLLAQVAVTTIDLDPHRPDADAARAYAAFVEQEAPGHVFVTHEDEAHALSDAMALRDAPAGRRARITVRTRSRGGLAAFLDEDRATLQSVGLEPFSLLDETCRAEFIDGGTTEQLARAIHEDYRARARGWGGTSQPWEALPPELKEDNRRTADLIAQNLSDAGWEVVPIRRWDQVDLDPPFSEEAIDAMAARDHQRWLQARFDAGWTLGDHRDDVAKTNPLLLPWDELSEDTRAYNRDTIRQLPRLLARAGFEVVPVPAPVAIPGGATEDSR